jgi:hypothetical protein
MPQYLLSVHGADSDYDPAAGRFGAYASQEEAESAFAATGAFNEKLVAEGSAACRGQVEVRPFQSLDGST